MLARLHYIHSILCYIYCTGTCYIYGTYYIYGTSYTYVIIRHMLYIWHILYIYVIQHIGHSGDVLTHYIYISFYGFEKKFFTLQKFET